MGKLANWNVIITIIIIYFRQRDSAAESNHLAVFWIRVHTALPAWFYPLWCGGMRILFRMYYIIIKIVKNLLIATECTPPEAKILALFNRFLKNYSKNEAFFRGFTSNT